MQTVSGVQKMRETMIKKHGSEEAWKAHMRENARKGGSKGGVKGFAAMDRQKHLQASIKGGSASRRGKKNA